jgi:hypothetical protein
MKELVPEYVVPCRKTIKNYLTKKYEDQKAKLILSLEGQRISFTTDHWTSLANESYMTVTAHYIDLQWELQSAVLQTVLMSERHTGENIATRLQECATEFNIPQSNVMAVVRDGAANMGAAMDILNKRGMKVDSVECVAHTLQLAVKAGLASEGLDDLLSKCRKLVGHFKHSAQATTHLKARQQDEKDTYLILTQECKTRWNSTYMMLDRLIRLRWPISKVK